MTGSNGDQARTMIDVTAESWHRHLASYRRAGFTDDQAFALTLAAFRTVNLLGEIHRVVVRPALAGIGIDASTAREAFRRLLDEDDR